jgi:hypothetical protein
MLLLLPLLLAVQAVANPGGYARPELLVDTAGSRPTRPTRTSASSTCGRAATPTGTCRTRCGSTTTGFATRRRRPTSCRRRRSSRPDGQARHRPQHARGGLRRAGRHLRGPAVVDPQLLRPRNVALLNGGWKLDAGAARRPPPTPRRPRIRAVPGQDPPHGHATAGDVLAAINKPGREDRRCAQPGRDRRQGLPRHQARGVHRVVRAGVLGRHVRPEDARVQARRGDHEALPRPGILPSDEVITYCQVGMRASHDLFTLALIGHDLGKLRNYYGAWEEWGTGRTRPSRRSRKPWPGREARSGPRHDGRESRRVLPSAVLPHVLPDLFVYNPSRRFPLPYIYDARRGSMTRCSRPAHGALVAHVALAPGRFGADSRPQGMVVSQSDIASEVGWQVIRTAATPSTPRWPRPSRWRSRTPPPATSAAAASSSIGRRRARPPPTTSANGAGRAESRDVAEGRQVRLRPAPQQPPSVGVPGTVAGLHLAWKEHGSKPWKDLVEPGGRAGARRVRGEPRPGAVAGRGSSTSSRSIPPRSRSSRRTASPTRPATC